MTDAERMDDDGLSGDAEQLSSPSLSHHVPTASQRLTFPKSRHLRSGRDFERIFAARHKAANRNLVIFGDRNRLGWTRIGFSISRRHGNSVCRHRLRRLLREAYRLEQFQIPEGLDLVLIPGREAQSATQRDFCQSLVFLVRRLEKQLSVHHSQSSQPGHGTPSP